MEDRIREIIREVVKEVLGEAAGAKKPAPARTGTGPRVLVVYHTGMERLEEALAQVALIEERAGKAAFWQGPEARELMCPADLKDRTGARCSLNTVGGEGLTKVLDLSQVVVLPTLSLKVAARVVRLTADCPGSDLVLTALLKGKRVIAASDGFLAPGANPAPALQKEIDQTMAALAGYGAILCPTSDLAKAYGDLAGGGPKAKPGPESEIAPAPDPKRLITARDITSASEAGAGRVVLAPKGLVSPLARDLAKEYQIEIITENE